MPSVKSSTMFWRASPAMVLLAMFSNTAGTFSLSHPPTSSNPLENSTQIETTLLLFPSSSIGNFLPKCTRNDAWFIDRDEKYKENCRAAWYQVLRNEKILWGANEFEFMKPGGSKQTSLTPMQTPRRYTFGERRKNCRTDLIAITLVDRSTFGPLVHNSHCYA